MPSRRLILCHPALLLPSIFPSIGVFTNESIPHTRWPKHWSYSFSIRLSNEYSGLISWRIDCLDLPVVQGTLNSLLRHHSSKASLLPSAFYIVQLSHPYMTTGKPTALTIWFFVGKVMSLFFNSILWNQAKINEVPPMQGLKLEDEDVNNSIHLITQWFKSVTLKEFMDNLGDNYTTVGIDVYNTERWVVFTQ